MEGRADHSIHSSLRHSRRKALVVPIHSSGILVFFLLGMCTFELQQCHDKAFVELLSS